MPGTKENPYIQVLTGIKEKELLSEAPTADDQYKAQWKCIIATTYKIIGYHVKSIERFNEAIHLFAKDVNKNSKLLRDSFLNKMELHSALANKYHIDNAVAEAIQNEYVAALAAADNALKMLANQPIGLEKLHYYKGQTSYFLAKHLAKQVMSEVATLECIKLLTNAATSFLTALTRTKPEASQKKVFERLTECYELFKQLPLNVAKENSSIVEEAKYNYVQLNRFMKTTTSRPAPNQFSSDKEAIKKLLAAFSKPRSLLLTNSYTMVLPLKQHSLKSSKEELHKQGLPFNQKK